MILDSKRLPGALEESMISYERFAQWLLPFGVILALFVGLIWPSPGEVLGQLQMGPLDAVAVTVIVIFLVSGVALLGASVQREALPRAIVAVLALNLIAAPVLAGVFLAVLPLSSGLAFGVAAMASVPTTLSSATVLTQVANGDRVWGAALTVLCVFVGALTAPLAVSLLLRTEATIPTGTLLLRLILLVLVPLGVGYGLARMTGWRVNRIWRVVPSFGVIVLAWITVSQSADSIEATPGTQLLEVVVLVIVAHAVMLILARLAAMKFPRDRAIAVFFVTAQKTLPLALTVISAVAALVPELRAVASQAVIVAVLWHFVQTLVDGSIAARLGKVTAR